MASVLFKNTGGGLGYKFQSLYGPYLHLPPDAADGICPNLTMNAAAGEWQSMPLQAAATRTEHGTSFSATRFMLASPMAPAFFKSVNTLTFDYEIEGLDHFGEKIQSVGSILSIAGGAVGGRTWRVFSEINAVRVRRTDAVGGTPTLSLGFMSNAGTGSNPTLVLPLPTKLETSKQVLGARLVNAAGLTLNPGGGTANGWDGNSIVAALGGLLQASALPSLYATLGPDSVLPSNNTYWTPNRLAQVGLFAVSRALYVNAAANAELPEVKVLVNPATMTGS